MSASRPKARAGGLQRARLKGRAASYSLCSHSDNTCLDPGCEEIRLDAFCPVGLGAFVLFCSPLLFLWPHCSPLQGSVSTL